MLLTEQQNKALDTKRNIFLTANAGAGKTTVLSKRFIQSVLDDNISVKNIVAITFTEKAAGELLQKITREIDEAIQSTKEVKEKTKLQEFRNYILSARISTIHSFCTEILKTYPVESGVDFNFRIIESFEDKKILNEIIEEVILQNLNNELIKDLIIFCGKNSLTNQLSELIHKNYLTDKIIEIFYSRDFKYYKSLVDKIFNDIFNSPDIKSKISNLLEILRELKKYFKKESKEYELIIEKAEGLIDKKDYSKFFNILPDILQVVVLSKGSNFKKSVLNLDKIPEELKTYYFNFIKDFISEFDDFLKPAIFTNEYEEKKYKYTLVLIELYQQLKEKLQREKRRQGVVNFNDLLYYTFLLLKNNDSVRKELSDKIKYLLVDEFQDTDEIQYEIIKKITNDFDDKHFVFFIGDDKQSIFGWRDANIEIFNRAKEELIKKSKNKETVTIQGSILDLSGNEQKGHITLPENFRLLMYNLAFVNKFFTELDSKLNLSDQPAYFRSVPYEELIFARKNKEPGKIEIISGTEEFPEEKQVADKIVSLINEKFIVWKYDSSSGEEKPFEIKFGDIALLFREKSDMKPFEWEFASRGIPYFVNAGKGFYQTEEIQDWLSFMQFLSNPDDDIAFAALLRAPFFALSDEDLYKIALVSNSGSFFSKFKTAANKFPDLFDETFKTIDAILNLRGKLTLPELIRRILVTTSYLKLFETNPRFSQIQANVNKLLDLARDFEVGGFVNLNDFYFFLKENWLNVEDEGEASVSGISDAVILMTQHTAKGLEFPVVIVPKSQKAPRLSANNSDVLLEEKTGINFDFPFPEQGLVAAKSNVIGNYIKGRQILNEVFRLYYVTLTRARDYLIISYSPKSKTGYTDNFSLINLLTNCFSIDFTSEKKLYKFKTSIRYLNHKTHSIAEDKKEIDLVIKIYTPVKENLKLPLPEKRDFKKIKVELKETDFTKIDETFTATHIMTYADCGRKYLLKYIYRVDNKIFRNVESLRKKKSSSLSPTEYGTLFHNTIRLLSSVPANQDELKKFISDNIIFSDFVPDKKTIQKLYSDLSNFASSELGKKIFSYKIYKSEFSINTEYNNNYFMGIIDRLIISDDEIIIVDYKTNVINEKTLLYLVDEYSVQMEFYAYLVSRYFGKEKRITSILVFLNDIGKSITKFYDVSVLKSIENKISLYISKILGNDGYSEKNIRFPVNKEHCPRCEFFIDNKCIMDK